MRKLLFAASSLVMGVLFVVLCVEIGMRVLGVSYPLFFVPHDVAGARMWPNLRAWYTLEGRSFVEVNSIGFRDVDHDPVKSDSEFRIAFLGDSYTEGLQVPFEDIYWNVASRALEACPALGGKAPVPMNFGLSGIGTAQQLEILRSLVWDYHPDMVVLAFVGNDLTDNHPAYGGRGLKPFYLFDERGELVLDDSFRRSPTFLARNSRMRNLRREIIQRSRFLQLLVEVRASIVRRDSLDEAAKRGGQLNRPPSTERLREVWKVTEATLARLIEEVRSHGSEFLLFTVTSGHQVHPDSTYRKDRMSKTDVDDPQYLNKRLSNLARREGAAFSSLVDLFLSYAEKTGKCLHGFENSLPCGGHWNSEGHRLAGEEIASVICGQLSEQADLDVPSSPSIWRGSELQTLDR